MKKIVKNTRKAVFDKENKKTVIMGLIDNVPDCNFTVKTKGNYCVIFVESPYEWEVTTTFKNGMVTEDFQLHRDSQIRIVTPINCF